MQPDAGTDDHDLNARRAAERSASFRAGVHAILPALIATGTWGLVTGVAMVKSGLTENMALAMTLLIYAGSAQLTSLPLIATGAPLWLVFLAGFVVNVRFIIFGAALHPFFRHMTWPKRLFLGYFTTDMSFVLFMPRYGDAAVRGTRDQLWFFLGVIVPGWITWQSSSILGIYLGSMVPTAWSLDFAAVLALLAITVPLASSRPVITAMLAAGVTAWVGQLLPLRLGLVAAVAAGILAGVWAERRLKGTS
ncbi:Branched-chain amino acid transport protein AzlC [plant metagenome]|uniref:Branched-chain amino acid transport protein AzlC n=1 Tax=plant metagenome TaxID=1297885 RepID=A0A484T7M9_9ZZZZ